jgi:hypothetical protein
VPFLDLKAIRVQRGVIKAEKSREPALSPPHKRIKRAPLQADGFRDKTPTRRPEGRGRPYTPSTPTKGSARRSRATASGKSIGKLATQSGRHSHESASAVSEQGLQGAIAKP